MERLSFEVSRYLNHVYLKIISQPEWTREMGVLFTHKYITFYSDEALSVHGFYGVYHIGLRGSTRESDDAQICCTFDTIEEAANFLNQLEEAVKHFNLYFENPTKYCKSQEDNRNVEN